MDAVILAIILIAAILAVYTVYKVIWYAVKMLYLKSKLNNPKIKFITPFKSIIFGKKGKTNFLIKGKTQTTEVSVLSFISTHGRWNIEKARTRYYFESRRYNKIFYNEYKNTGTEPEHSKQYRRESRIFRSVLEITPSQGNKVILIYPKPKELTYTDHKLEYLGKGSKIENYSVMFLDDVLELIK